MKMEVRMLKTVIVRFGKDNDYNKNYFNPISLCL